MEKTTLTSERRLTLTHQDEAILRAVHKHRYLQTHHLHLLLGAGAQYLEKRCRLLAQAGYLQRPADQRSSAEKMIYAVGRKALPYLGSDTGASKDLVETPRKQRTLGWIHHQLGVANFMVLLEVACNRAGYVLHWDGQPFAGRYKVHPRGAEDPRFPDAYFSIEFPTLPRRTHYFLEYDRGSHPERMRARYDDYYAWWQDRRAEEKQSRPRRSWAKFTHFRLLTIAEDENHMHQYRQAGGQVGDVPRYGAWLALRFTHTGLYDVAQPESVLGPVFHFAEGAKWKNPAPLLPQDVVAPSSPSLSPQPVLEEEEPPLLRHSPNTGPLEHEALSNESE